MNEKMIYNNNKFFYNCKNCGKRNHSKKNCKDPITSCGIICIKFKDDTLKKLFMDNLEKMTDKTINIFSYNSSFIQKNPGWKNMIELLIVQRKHSYSFIELLLGDFDFNDIYISKLLKELTENEKNILMNKSYNNILQNNLKINEKTVNINKKKRFQSIRELIFKKEQSAEYKELEWGFPKGRRSMNETNTMCSIREFCEETSYSHEKIRLLNNVLPVKEIFKGNNNVFYKYIYYFAVLEDTLFSPFVEKYNNEINQIKWVSFKNIDSFLRDSHIEKKKIINQLYLFIEQVISYNIRIREYDH